MNVKFLRLLAAFLAILMLATVCFTGCADAGNEDNPSDTSAKLEETDAEKYTPNLPDADYGKNDFILLTSGELDDNGADWQSYDVYAEGIKSEAINDAVYTRNDYLQNKYNFVLVEEQSKARVLDEAKKAIKSGDDHYAAIFGNFAALANLADQKSLIEVDQLTYIDPTQPWWDQNAVSSCSINNKLFYLTGDITVIDNDATWVLYFNTQMINKKQLDSPYDLIDNNEWTYEKFLMMMQTAQSDGDGDGKITPNPESGDVYGFATTTDSSQGLIFAGGISFVEKDEDDIPYNSLDVSKLSEVITSAAAIMNDDSCFNLEKDKKYGFIGADDVRTIFQDERSLFYGEVLQCAERMRGSTTDFGLVTWPKFTTAQSRYYNFVHATAGKAVGVPVTVGNLDRSALILEAMAAESKNTLTPAYYEICLSGKYLRDEQSVRMLDTIVQSTVYDLGYIYDSSWASVYTQMRNLILTNKPNNVASTYKKLQSKFEKAMGKTIDKYN